MKHLYAAGTFGKVYAEDLGTLKEARETAENLRNGRTKTVVVLRVTLAEDGTAYDPRYKVLGSSGTWTKWKEVK